MRVFVTAIEGATALNTVSVLDALAKADTAWRFLVRPDGQGAFEPMAVGVDERPITFAHGVQVSPTAVAGRDPAPDLVVVPGLDDDVLPSLARNGHWVEWLARWHAEGAVVASSCTGAFVLAEAGLLDGRRATTHWIAEGLFRVRYPSVDLAIDRVVVDTGDVITSGGATTAFNLVLYLVARFGSRDRARAATQMLLLDSGRDSQLPFVMLGLHRDHDDHLVHAAQAAIDEGAVAPMTVERLAAHVGVSSRTLSRRFGAALGVSPKTYLDEVRIEAAKRLLHSTDDTIERIRSHVGFSDPTAFRRAFRRWVGVTPSEYRRRFARDVAPRTSAGR